MNLKNILSFLILIFILKLSIYGQNSAASAAISGVVRDAAGEIVSGAAITARDTATNQTRQATSRADGTFYFAALPVSTYEIRVEAAGFAPYVNPQVTIALGQTMALEVTLQPAGVSEAVVVRDQPPVIDSSQTASTVSIDPERIEELPVNSRNYLQFTLTAPGVAPSNTQAASGGATVSNSPFADSGFTFGGLRPRSNSISIDGLDNTDETTGAARVALSPEIVREFQIVNNGISAEFGGAAGGAINIITKTGSNDFHGTLFSFIQNERFNARDPLFGGDSAKRPKFRRYQPGGSLGGPVIKNRLFFYAAAEQENFNADEEVEINKSALARINAALANGFAPRLSVRRLNSNFFGVGADETEAAGKLTYLLNPRNTLNLRFAFSNNRLRKEAFNTDALADPSARGSSYTKDYQLTGSIVSVLTPEAINNFRFQFSQRRVLTRAGDANSPGIEIVGAARFGTPENANGERREKRQQFADTISLTRGSRQEWKAGAEINRVALNADLRENFSGYYIFPTVEDFLAARPTAFRQAFGDSRTKFSVVNFGAFVQNRWQAARRLTLNLGARYDLEKLPAPFRTDRNNFSPRFGVAFGASEKWVLRAGFGLFYDRLPLAFLNPAIQKNGAQAFEQIAYERDAAQIFAASGGRLQSPLPNVAPSIYRADPNFETPYSVQSFAGIEHLLTKDTTVRAEFLFTRGVHLPRTRNVNLLPPIMLTTNNAAALGIQNPTPQQIGRFIFGASRIDPRYDAVYQLENSASSTYRGLTAAINKRLSGEVEFLASYTLSKTTDDASDFNEQPANSYDLRAERALSLQDVRHRFVLSGIFELPFDDEKEENAGGKDNLLKEIFGDIEIAPIVTFSSGRPVNPLTGADEERSRAFPTASRPLGFARNSLKTPNFFNTDLRVVKYVPLSESSKIDFAFEFFNLFNKTNVAVINPFYGSNSTPLNNFRTPTLFNAPRQFRFSLDYEF